MSGNESGPEIGAAPVPEPSAPVPEPSRPPGPPEKRVSWGELFFDLVFVFAVTETSTLLAQDHSVAGLVRALIVFVPVYWVWVGTSVQANLHDVDRPRLRLGIFAIALAGLFMALALPDVYGDRALLFAGSYWGARLVLGAPMNLRGIWHAHPYSVSMLVSVTRLTAAGVVLIALPAARYVPALAALIGLAVILAVLNVVEFARAERIGWRAVLARRTADA